MKVIDTHCHIDLPIFDDDRYEIINKCTELGIENIIVPAIQSASWDQLLSTTNEFAQLHPSLGLHPVFIQNHCQEDIQKLEQYVDKYKPIAIGEIGLDFYIKDTDKAKQQEFFSKQLTVAKKYTLPVILHVRKAHADTLAMLKSCGVIGGSCHAFNGSYEQAKEYINLGFKLGFGGTMTYPQSRKIHDLARKLPLDSIILETDAPDMSGFNHKGKRNQPDFVLDALSALAKIRNESIEEIANQTTSNAKTLFNI